MTETITWLHISDTLFCREKNGWVSEEILEKFFEDLKFMEKHYNLIPDIIFFTGDVAFGQDYSKGLFLKGQYDEAQEFIEKLSNSFTRIIPKANIFIVPGDHDVNRTQVTQDQVDWLRNLLKSGKEKAIESINELLKTKNKQWIRYMERLEDYRDFLNRGGYNHLLDDPNSLIYSKMYEINGYKIGITGLNSAWSSSGDSEKGNLWLGINQIYSSYNCLKDVMFSIVLIHHPLSWFNEFEEFDISKSLERRYNFCLHGHEHNDWITYINKHIRIASGSLYGGRGTDNVYNFVRLYPKEDKGEIFLRKYDHGNWIPFIIGINTDNNGIFEIRNLDINPNKKEEKIVSVKSDFEAHTNNEQFSDEMVTDEPKQKIEANNFSVEPNSLEILTSSRREINNTVTWLHISDTHFCRDRHNHYSKKVFESFFDDLKLMKKKYKLNPDLIFFTGDVAYGCTELTFGSQYKEAEEFLERIRTIFSKENNEDIYIVPGNHDVNQKRISNAQTLWLESLRKFGREEGSLKVNESLIKKDMDFQECMQRLDDYKSFLQINYSHLLQDPDRLTYSTVRNIYGFNVGIVGLNSVWSSRGSDEDMGRLWLGTYQILEACNRIENTTFSIILSHYPPDWFVFNEQRLMKEEIRNNFEFHLHGHDHDGWVTLVDNYIRISSGALYNGFGQRHGYNFVRLYPNKNRGEVFLRTYNNGIWIQNIIGNKTNYEGRWNLKKIKS